MGGKRRQLLAYQIGVIGLGVILLLPVLGSRRSGGNEAAAAALPAGSLLPAPVQAEQPKATNVTYIITFAPFAYTPRTVLIQPGDTVEWSGTFSQHPLVSDDGLWTTNNTGTTFSHTFNTPGVYRFHCFFHGGPNGFGMSGMVVVGEYDYLPLMEK